MKAIAKAAIGKRRVVARKAEGSIDARAFAALFNAEEVGSAGKDTNPFTLWQIGRELENVLVSSGGRPSLAGGKSQIKINVLDEDIPAIREIVENVSVGKYKPSPSQVVAILLHMAISQFSKEEIGNHVRRAI